MGVINVDGLGEVEIQGNIPTKEEQNAIIEALKTGKKTTNDESDSLDLTKKKLEGLEYIGVRGTFEAAGAVFGGGAGMVAGNPITMVAGGTLAATGAGQFYDIVQGYLTDEDRSMYGQFSQMKKDLSREALLQTFFSKIPGFGRWIKGRFVRSDGSTKSLYESAKRMNFPLSISDSGNLAGRTYGKVIGIFPFVGTPHKQQIAKKADILNKSADDILNSFAPNVSLTNLGVDMVEAAKSTYGNFRRISGFFYDDFYKTASKIKQPVISTQNFKNAALSYVSLIDDGIIKIGGKNLKTPQKDAIYKYAKSITKMPEYINISQYKSVMKDINKFSKLSQKEGYDLKTVMGLKGGLELDLNLLTNPKYYNQFKKVVDPNLMIELADKLKFANKVFTNGLENSMITKTMKTKFLDATGKKIIPISGKKIFDSPAAKRFESVDKKIFSSGFERPGGIYADELADKLLRSSSLTPKLLDDLNTLVGNKQYKNFVRQVLQKGYNKSIVDNGQKNGLMFDPFKFEDALGLTTDHGREIMKTLLKGSNLTINKLDDFFNIAKNHGSLSVPDVSSFVQRRVVLGGTKTIFGGLAMGYGVTTNPLRGLGLIYLARRGSTILDDPKNLELVMDAMNYNSSGFKVYNSLLKIADGLLSDKSNTQEAKSHFYDVTEYLESNKNALIKGFDEEKEE